MDSTQNKVETAQASQNRRYNGWTNYETCLVKLWIDNEENSQNYWQEEAQRAFERAEADTDPDHVTFTKSENAAFELRDWLKDQHEEIAFEQIKANNGFVHDLLNAALSEVNWHEIATSLLEDIEESEVA